MTTVKRYDRGELQKRVKQANGWVRVDGFLTRTGIFEYRGPKGELFKEYRPPEEVFHADSLESFALVPLTNNHPPSGLLDAENTKMYQVGTVVAPKPDGDMVRSQILVTDAATVADMEAGKVELSCGYTCDLEMTPGEINGERYDAVQKNIRGNHVALVQKGRAGEAVKVRMDASDGAMIALSVSSNSGEIVTKIRIDGVEYEVSESAAQAIQKAQEIAAKEVADMKADIAKHSARADSLEIGLKNAQEELKAAPEKLKSELTARAALEATAKEALGETKVDELSDVEIRKAVAAHVLGMKLDGKDDAYVAACFDLACQKLADAKAVEQAKAGTTKVDSKNDGSDPVEAAKKAYFEEINKNFKK